jgi:6-phosphogluconolactonase
MFGEVRTVDDVPQAFAALVADTAPSSIALSGGTTARKCYELLATIEAAWESVDVWFGDERWVPVHDPDSNEGMARTTFLDEVEPRVIHSMYQAGMSPEEGADAYDALLRAAPPVGLTHLGLGPDGHTASLFPGNASLEVRDRFVITTGDAEHPHPRLSFTYPAIERSELVVFTVAGADKREAFSKLLAGDEALPSARVRAGRVIWLVDRAANPTGAAGNERA